MSDRSRDEVIRSLRDLRQEKTLWMVVLYEVLLLVPALMKGIRETKDEIFYFGYHYLDFLPILIVGTIGFYWLTKYRLKGNHKIVLYSAILLTWGVLMEVLLLFPNDDRLNTKFIINKILLLLVSYLAAAVVGFAFLRFRRFRGDSFTACIACISVLLYGLLFFFGVGPGGKINPEAKTNLPFPVIGSIPITEILKVTFLMVLVCLLCKQSKTRKEKRVRLLWSAIYTAMNMLGMLAINEMGSLLIVLLVYIAFIVVYMQETRYSVMVLAMGIAVLAAGILVGTLMIHSVNKKISAKDLMSCFYDLEISTANGYHGSSGTVGDFRPYLAEYLEECAKEKDNRLIRQDEMEKMAEDSFDEALDETVQTAIVELFSIKDQIGYEDMELFVSDKKNQSMKLAMCYLFADQEDKEDFLNQYYFAKVYSYYAYHSDANALERFYLPKYGKVMTRFYCWLHPEWDNGDTGYQNYRARIGVRAGGLFGKEAIGVSTVPNADSDMVFVAVSEMFGNICTILLLSIFFLLFWEGKKVALSTKQEYNSGMIFGISFMIWIQAIFMTASNCGMFPIFGMPIPFISNGGTSKCITMAMIGIMVVMSAKESEYSIEEDERSKSRMLVLVGYFVLAPITEFLHRLSVKCFGRLDERMESEEEKEEEKTDE